MRDASKGKKGESNALPFPMLEPPQLEPAQKEVDKTTNVKAKKKKAATTFSEQQKDAGFKDVNKEYALHGPVVAHIVITIALNFHSPIVTYHNKAHRFFMLVSDCICTYQFVTNPLH